MAKAPPNIQRRDVPGGSIEVNRVEDGRWFIRFGFSGGPWSGDWLITRRSAEQLRDWLDDMIREMEWLRGRLDEFLKEIKKRKDD